ncbi:pantoate--beta-alanine ligase, partial [Phenylobacterium sp.]|uniref:4-phosphopantoate--beta-alanine ligase n=1 Tax=Phenylobacterium sp. TaxID=1871053 RepID=UPI00286D4588
LAGASCDLLFAPSVTEMYAPGFSTRVEVSGVTEPLDGAARPGHFGGVALIVAKLLIQCGPDVAVFGEKDYQQLQVIKRLVADLDIPTEVLGGPTARAPDGLALSSRNAYLTPEQREVAPALAAALQEAGRRLRAGESVERVEATGLAALERAGFGKIDYFEVRHPVDLTRLGPGRITGEARILAAAHLGKTRLIDNMAIA